MKHGYLHRLLSVGLSLTALFGLQILRAQSFPELPTAPHIKKGALDNGISYYLVKNPRNTGTVDFALVQRTGYGDETPEIRGESLVNSRGVLSDLPRFSQTSPFRFLMRKALYPGTSGYVTVSENATVYRFDEIIVSGGKEAIDSTLLLIFDIISESAGRSERYAPAASAIVAAGDIDQNQLLEKMKTLALIVPKGAKSPDRLPEKAPTAERSRRWTDRQETVFRFSEPPADGQASILAEYVSPGIPSGEMNTALSLTAGKWADELMILARNRLGNELHRKKIPYSLLDCRHYGSGEGAENERFRFQIATGREELSAAVSVLSSVLADLDRYGTIPEEYGEVRNEFKIKLGEDYVREPESNAGYVGRCIAAFLYGAPLSSAQYNYDFFEKKKLGLDKEVSLFNSYVSGILDGQRNLTLYCGTAEPSEALRESLLSTFRLAWEAREKTDRRSFSVFAPEASSLKRYYPKARLKTESPEPMTGGKIWTFSNEMRVIYKKAGQKARFHYSLLLKTGFSQAVSLRNDERPYLSDLIDLYDLSGMTGRNFGNMLKANGISMSTSVSVSDMTVSGSAPADRLPLLLKSLLALGYERKTNPAAIDCFKRSAALQADLRRESASGRATVTDSLLCPSLDYTTYRRRTDFSPDLSERAEAFYETAFSRANDGVFLLIGDLEEEEVKKTFCKYLGGFKCDNASLYRTRMRDETADGRIVLVKDGRSPSLDLLFDTPINYTAENYLHANIAAFAMRDALSRAAARRGWSTETEGRFIMFPEEKFRLSLQMVPASDDGLPASMVRQTDVEELIAAVNREIDRLGRTGVGAEQFASYRSLLSDLLAEEMTNPEALLDFLVVRYSYGKDLMTKYKERLAGLKADKVNRLLADMAAGSLAEYGVRTPTEERITEAAVPSPRLPEAGLLRPAADTTGMGRLYRDLFPTDPPQISPTAASSPHE